METQDLSWENSVLRLPPDEPLSQLSAEHQITTQSNSAGRPSSIISRHMLGSLSVVHARLHILKKKVSSRVAFIKRLAGVGWGASFKALRTSCLALAFAPAEYCAQRGAAALTQNSSMYFQTSRCALSLAAYEAHPPPSCPFYLALTHLKQFAVLHAWNFTPTLSIRNISDTKLCT